MLARMPIVRSIYKGAKQIFETAFSQSGATFRGWGMIEYPGKRPMVPCFHMYAAWRNHRRASFK